MSVGQHGGEMRGKGGEIGRGPSRRVSKTLSKPSHSMIVVVVWCAKRPQELRRMMMRASSSELRDGAPGRSGSRKWRQ